MSVIFSFITSLLHGFSILHYTTREEKILPYKNQLWFLTSLLGEFACK